MSAIDALDPRELALLGIGLAGQRERLSALIRETEETETAGLRAALDPVRTALYRVEGTIRLLQLDVLVARREPGAGD